MAAEFADGCRYLLRTPLVLGMTVLQMVVNLCLAAETLVVFLARDTLGLSAPLVGVAVAGGGLAGWRAR